MKIIVVLLALASTVIAQKVPYPVSFVVSEPKTLAEVVARLQDAGTYSNSPNTVVQSSDIPQPSKAAQPLEGSPEAAQAALALQAARTAVKAAQVAAQANQAAPASQRAAQSQQAAELAVKAAAQAAQALPSRSTVTGADVYYRAVNPGAHHEVPLPGHPATIDALNLEPAPGTR